MKITKKNLEKLIKVEIEQVLTKDIKETKEQLSLLSRAVLGISGLKRDIEQNKNILDLIVEMIRDGIPGYKAPPSGLEGLPGIDD